MYYVLVVLHSERGGKRKKEREGRREVKTKRGEREGFGCVSRLLLQ